jgi:hypothetical protein
VAGSCEHTNEHLGSMKTRTFLTSRDTVSFLKMTLLYGVSCRNLNFEILVQILLDAVIK